MITRPPRDRSRIPYAHPDVNITRSHGITLRNLTISVNSGGGRAVFIHNQSEVTLDGVIAENSGQCIAALDQSVLTAGGKLAINAVTAQGCGTGIALDSSSLISNGFLTVQNNTIAGIDARTATR